MVGIKQEIISCVEQLESRIKTLEDENMRLNDECNTELKYEFTEWFFSGNWVYGDDCYIGVNENEGVTVKKADAYRYALNALLD